MLFQWGRIDGYKHGDENNQFSTNIPELSEICDQQRTLLPKFDAVHVNMGGKWQIPTKDDLEELLNNTTHEVKTINGVKGMMFTSVINGNKLFIPFAGSWNGSFNTPGYGTCIWSSQVNIAYEDSAYLLYCTSSDVSISENLHNRAYSVRGVVKKTRIIQIHQNHRN